MWFLHFFSDDDKKVLKLQLIFIYSVGYCHCFFFFFFIHKLNLSKDEFTFSVLLKTMYKFYANSKFLGEKMIFTIHSHCNLNVEQNNILSNRKVHSTVHCCECSGKALKFCLSCLIKSFKAVRSGFGEHFNVKFVDQHQIQKISRKLIENRNNLQFYFDFESFIINTATARRISLFLFVYF